MKHNPMLAKIEARHQAELRVTRHRVRQETADLALMALHTAFGFGPERSHRFLEALNRELEDNIDLCQADTPDKEYAVAKHEEKLRRVAGKYYVPRGERYAL